MPSESDAIRTVLAAIDAGVTHIDTARAYGDSERRIGLALRQVRDAERITIVTKLDPMPKLPDTSDAGAKAAVSEAEASLRMSMRELAKPALDVVLLHRWRQHGSWGGAVWRKLLEDKEAGRIRALGASVASPAELGEALSIHDITYVQLPFNILDQRWIERGIQSLLKTRPDVNVHVRSVFLQGILLGDSSAWPKLPGIDSTGWLARLNKLVLQFGRRGFDDLCIAYVRAQPWVTSLVLGVESVAQLKSNAELFAREPLSLGQVSEALAALEGADETLLNPALWPQMRRNRAFEPNCRRVPNAT